MNSNIYYANIVQAFSFIKFCTFTVQSVNNDSVSQILSFFLSLYFENPINFYVILTFSHITILYDLTGNPTVRFQIFPAKKKMCTIPFLTPYTSQNKHFLSSVLRSQVFNNLSCNNQPGDRRHKRHTPRNISALRTLMRGTRRTNTMRPAADCHIFNWSDRLFL